MRLALSIVLCLGACTRVGSSFHCSSDAQCAVSGQAETCDTSVGYCTLPDSSCTMNGRKYDDSAGGGLAGICVGAVTTDAGAGGPSQCSSFNGIACQGFESPIAEPWGTFVVGGGSIQIDTSRFYRGKSSAHINAPSDAKNTVLAAQLNYIGVTPGTNPLYMRGFYWANTPPPYNAPLMAFQDPNDSNNSHVVNFQANGNLLISDSEAGTASGSFRMPLGRWVCLELFLDAASSGMVTLSIDGTVNPAFTESGNTTGKAPTSLVTSGVYFYAPNDIGAWELWVDELAISTSPIGCAL